MHFATCLDNLGLPFNPFKSCTVPRPIGWLSSVDERGVCNLAPCSQWQNLVFDPPMVMLAANQTDDGRRAGVRDAHSRRRRRRAGRARGRVAP